MSWLVTDMLFLHGKLVWISSYGSMLLISTCDGSTSQFQSNLNCPENFQALLAELCKTRGLVWFVLFNGVVTLPSKETDCTSARTTFCPIFTHFWYHNNLQEQIFMFLQKFVLVACLFGVFDYNAAHISTTYSTTTSGVLFVACSATLE